MAVDTLAALLGLTVPLVAPLDAQVLFAAQAVSRLIRQHVDRFLTLGPQTEDFLCPTLLFRDPRGLPSLKVSLVETPIISLTSITLGGNTIDVSSATIHRTLGTLWVPATVSLGITQGPLRVTYQGGLSPLPGDIAAVFLELAARQLSAMGVTLPSSAAAPVKAVTVGALKLEYAVAAQGASAATPGGISPVTADAVAAFGTTLDHYKTARAFAGTSA